MKKLNNFGKVFGLAAVAVFALVFGGCEDLVGKLTGKTLTGEVTITGTPKVGSQLTAEAATSATAPLVYAWQKKEAPVLGGGAEDEGTAPEPEWITIEGATGATYTPVGDDIGHYVKVVVTAAGYSGALAKEADGTVTSGSLQGENGNGEGNENGNQGGEGNEGNGGTPVSGMYVLSTAGGKTAVAEEGNTETGTAWTWALETGEELTAYFAVVKTANQTVTAGTGKDAEKVTVYTGLEEEVAEVDGTTPGETEVVVEVDMEDLLFDGTDANGKATRTFDLVVSEDGKTPVTVTVNLELTLDAATDATIYYKDPEAGRWTKATGEDGTVPAITSQQAVGCLALEAGPVAKLKDALAWVIANAKTGTGNEYTGVIENNVSKWPAERFTEGYAEYRILVKAGAGIPKVNFSCPNAKYVSLELYGAGKPGKAEHTIFFDSARYSGVLYTIEPETTDSANINNASGYTKVGGLFTLYNMNHIGKYPTLVLGKNITINGKNYDHNSTVCGTNGGIVSLIYIDSTACFIMKEHSRITGYTASAATGHYSPIITADSSANTNSGVYIQGGTITGNTTAGGVVSIAGTYKETRYFVDTTGDPKTALYYSTAGGSTKGSIFAVSSQADISGNASLTNGAANKVTVSMNYNILF